MTPGLTGSGPLNTWATGTVKLSAYTVPADATATATVGGAAASATVTVPGQRASFSFAGTAGQNVNLVLAVPNPGNAINSFAVINPDGSFLVNWVATYWNYTPELALTQTGNYVIEVAPLLTGSGSPLLWGTGTFSATLSLGS